MNGLSVVVPAYNEEKYLPATLAAIASAQVRLNELYSLPSEVVVVDNLSTDKTAEVARTLGARVISHDVRSIASVRNAGIKAAAYDLIFTIDADCELPAHGLVAVYETMQTGQFIGGTVNLKLLTNKIVPRTVAFIVQTLVSAVAGINGAIFFFLKDDALQFGGFCEERLIAEDSVFAIALKKLGQLQGKKFKFLKSVTVTTTDRKDSKLADFVPVIRHAIRAFRGKTVDRKHLGYWYDPKR